MYVFLFSISYSLCSVARFSSIHYVFMKRRGIMVDTLTLFILVLLYLFYLISVTLFGELIKHTANTLWFGEMCGIYTLHFGR